MTKEEIDEALRIVEDIKNLKKKLTVLLDKSKGECWNEDGTWSTKQYLYDYTRRIDDAETELFDEANLPRNEQ